MKGRTLGNLKQEESKQNNNHKKRYPPDQKSTIAKLEHKKKQ
jgi:hypothetical protein